ncbi:MAG: T9SS type A sorting domain-containing protein [Bacteroidetes bacterium]|nr:T9SS type A sorting domain-containing protein [Bacteroidota bacterium]
MNRKIFLIIIFLFSFRILNAQTFVKSVGTTTDDLVSSILQTNDNSYLLTGATKNVVAGFIDAVVMKMDSAGNILWTKAYGRGDFDQLTSAVQTYDGNFVCAGSVTDSSVYGRDVLVMKIDNAGNILWSKRYGTTGTDLASTLDGLIQTIDSGFVVVGITNNLTGTFNNDPFIMKLNSNGDTLWTKGFSNINNELFSSVRQTPDGGFIVTGRSNSFGNLVMDALLVKFDANGNIEWQKRYGGNAWEEAQAVSITNDGYVVAGSTTTFGAGGYDAMVFKTDTSGNIIWSTAIGGTNPDAMYAMVQTTDSGFVITGQTESYNAHRLNSSSSTFATDSAEVFTFKLNSVGDTVWCYGYGGYLLEESYGIGKTNDGRIMIAAQSYSFGDSLQGLVIITDENGIAGCNSKPIVPTVSTCPLFVDTTQFTEYSLAYTDNISLISGSISFADSTSCYLFTSIQNFENQKFSYSLQPNPSNNYVTVSGSFSSQADVKVYDLFGNNISYLKGVSATTKIDVKEWAAGIYIFQFYDGVNSSQQKFVKID